jgi:hypothetical protein
MTVLSSLLLAVLLATPAAAAPPNIEVYKTPTCGCCTRWVDHIRANGFQATVKDVPSTAEYRRERGIPDRLQSCHTAIVGTYTVEGHVPAADIHRLLKQKPKARGLAVPGMPLGSPGMEAPRREAYSVLLVLTDGTTKVFRTYSGD